MRKSKPAPASVASRSSGKSSEKRNRTLTVTLLLSERRMIERVASYYGNTSSSWSRMILMREAAKHDEAMETMKGAAKG